MKKTVRERPCVKPVNFMGVDVDPVSTRDLLERVLDFAGEDRQRIIMYVNAACMLLAEDNNRYRETLNQADLVYADGTGVILGAKLWGHRLPGRSTAADFMPDFCMHFADKGLSIFLLGAERGVAAEAAGQLKKKIPGLRIAGTHHGYFTENRMENIISIINRSKADILLVGLGAPMQEFWMLKHADSLTPKILWGVGGLFDFLSGRTPRGPQWLLDNGFEWLCRLMAEPRRLWRRYIPGNVRFIGLLIRHRLAGHYTDSHDT